MRRASDAADRHEREEEERRRREEGVSLSLITTPPPSSTGLTRRAVYINILNINKEPFVMEILYCYSVTLVSLKVFKERV